MPADLGATLPFFFHAGETGGADLRLRALVQTQTAKDDLFDFNSLDLLKKAYLMFQYIILTFLLKVRPL